MTVKRIIKPDVVAKKEKKIKNEYRYSTLSQECQSQGLLATEALLYALNSKSCKSNFVDLQINLNSSMLKTGKREYIARIINLPHKLRSPIESKVCLVTKDNIETYRAKLIGEGDDEDFFSTVVASIIGFKKFKSILRHPKEAKDLYHDYDLIICDWRLRKDLPKVIQGTVLGKSNRRFPLLVQINNPADAAVNPQAVGGSDSVDKKHVMKQIKSLCKNTSFVPTTGKSLSVIAGKRGMSGRQILENVDMILSTCGIKRDNIKQLFLVCDGETVPFFPETEVTEDKVEDEGY
ncbi:Utp30 protein [Martiniozyma asiatica (nom. inval.)]|nr:Utp30 protein [Martiniozyma asiatica]